jgi:hypothetical protein
MERGTKFKTLAWLLIMLLTVCHALVNAAPTINERRTTAGPEEKVQDQF